MKIYVIIGHMSFLIRKENHFREIRDEWREPNEENHPLTNERVTEYWLRVELFF